jgi:hypothetical protein
MASRMRRAMSWSVATARTSSLPPQRAQAFDVDLEGPREKGFTSRGRAGRRRPRGFRASAGRRVGR